MLKSPAVQLCRMFSGFVVVMLLLSCAGVSTAVALDIAWVSQSSNDVSFITALSNAGHNVTWEDSRYESLTGDKITELNAADLVIVSRNTDSTTYSTGTEPMLWNGLTTKLMLCSGYLARNIRWNWLNALENSGSWDQIVVDADDAAYKGLGVSNNESVDSYSSSVNSTASIDAGNGTLVAKADGASAYVMLARWAAGTEFYSGCGMTAGAERVYFPTDFFYSNLTPFGESVFHNLIHDDRKWIAKINFQAAGVETPTGYLADVGEGFGSRGNGLMYGWDDDITDRARDRDVHFDQRFDTLLHMFEADYTLRTWEISLPNGTYYVDLLCGDPSSVSLTNNVEVEGVMLMDSTPGTSRFDNYQNVEVTVTDGKLTVAPIGFAQQKILSIKIVSESDLTVDPEDYARSATIRFNGYTGSTALTNFPVLVRLSSSSPVSGWYNKADANGYDVQFTDADGNLLPHEFEKWNPGGESIVWVRVPLMDDPDDYIVMYWGRDGQTERDFWPRNVWSEGYAAVWHLGETSGTHFDSTGSGHDSTVETSVTQDTGGLIDGADYFPGNSYCNITVPYAAALVSAVKNDCTVSIWAHSDVAASAVPSDMAYMCDFGAAHGSGVGLIFNKSHSAFNNGKICAYYNSLKLGETTGEADTWYHVSLTHEGTNLVLYVNGSVDSTTNASALYVPSSYPLRIGAQSKDLTNPVRNWKGVLDEPRISSVARSSDWIRNEYDNQTSASTYCSFDVVPMGTMILLQ